MSQIIVVKDSANSKLRELESNATGELKVTMADVSLLATESSLSSLNAKVVAVDTGAVVVSSSALPTGAASESSLSALSAKVTAVDTGAVVVSSSALPSGAATESSLSGAAGSLSTLAGAVTAGVVQVSAGSVSASSTVVFTTQSVLSGATQTSSSVDIDAYKSVTIMGQTDNLDDPVDVEVSHDNATWYELNNEYIQPDYSSGHFGKNLCCVGARYIRLSKTNTSGSGEIIDAVISAK
tara:strand:+ start:2437 stop:3153 length:717 start_codon:yes stop_codon:yes gene_type:complete